MCLASFLFHIMILTQTTLKCLLIGGAKLYMPVFSTGGQEEYVLSYEPVCQQEGTMLNE